MSWDQIGRAIGKKIEKESRKDESTWAKSWSFHHHETGGGFGRFLFICGVLYAMSLLGMLEGIPLWTLAVIVIGFTAMRL